MWKDGYSGKWNERIGLASFRFHGMPIREIYLIRIKEKVDWMRCKCGVHRNSDDLLKNTSINHNKYPHLNYFETQCGCKEGYYLQNVPLDSWSHMYVWKLGHWQRGEASPSLFTLKIIVLFRFKNFKPRIPKFLYIQYNHQWRFSPLAITRLDIGVKFLQSLGVLYPYIKPWPLIYVLCKTYIHLWQHFICDLILVIIKGQISPTNHK
jgi:hypothetical protein